MDSFISPSVTVLVFLCVISVVVLVHEFGHFAIGRIFGMRVLTFSLGFGPRIIGLRHGETDYRVSAIPLGGYVKFSGEHPWEGTTDTRDFSSKPRWQRILVLFAGPATNCLFAIIIMTGVLAIHGIRDVSKVPPVIETVVADLPAFTAGFRVEDRIVKVDGKKVETAESFTAHIANYADKNVTIEVMRKGEPAVLVVKPAVQNGRAVIGITMAGGRREQLRPDKALIRSVDLNLYITKVTFSGIADVILRKRDVKDSFSGPISIALISGDAARQGMWALLILAALLSISIGLMNILPIPVLDGGHIFTLLLEFIARRDIPIGVKTVINIAGLAFIVMLMFAVIYFDIGKVSNS